MEALLLPPPPTQKNVCSVSDCHTQTAPRDSGAASFSELDAEKARKHIQYMCWRSNQKFQTWFSRAAATQTQLAGLNVVHNLPLSFPFPLQILSHVSTGSIILWKGSGWGMWVRLHAKSQQPQSSVNVLECCCCCFSQTSAAVVCLVRHLPCCFSCLSSLTQIMDLIWRLNRGNFLQCAHIITQTHCSVCHRSTHFLHQRLEISHGG